MTDMDTIRLQPPFEHIRGSGYRAILPEQFEHIGNTAENVFASPLRLLENGKMLKKPFADRVSIWNYGAGSYNHWGKSLIFSASDNSDPNLNGREYSIAIEKSENSAEPAFPKYIHAVLSLSCNLWCRICREKPVRAPFMELRLFDKICEELLPAPELRLDSGGEILLNPALGQILKKLSDRNQPFFTSTNAMLLTPKKARMLAESSLYHIQISLDSPQKETLEWIRRGANFERVIQGVKNIVQARRDVGRPFLIDFHAAVMRRNIRQMPDLVKLAHSLGIEGVTACHVFSHACFEPSESCFWDQDEHDEFREIAIETARSLGSFYYGPPPFKTAKDSAPSTPGCLYPDGGTYINADGTVGPCCVGPNHFLGDLNKQSFAEIWTGEAYNRLRQTYKCENPSFPHCKDCLGSQSATSNWQSYFAPEHWEYARKRLEGREAANDR